MKAKNAVRDGFEERVSDMIRCAIFDRPKRARELLAAEPELAVANLYAACVTGEVEEVLAQLKREPGLAKKKGGPNDWPPLLYASFSELFRTDKRSTPRFARIIKRLLELGADPNVAYLWEEKYPLTPLYAAAGRVNHPGLVKLLLKAGANPDDNESLYHSAEFRDHRCLKLLLKRGAKIEGTNAVLRKLDFDDFVGFKLFLDAGANPNQRSHDGTPLLHGAIQRGRGVKFLKLLAERGADLKAKDGRGHTAFRAALQNGHAEAAAFLRSRGTGEASTPKERLMLACVRGDVVAARKVLKANPGAKAALEAEFPALLSRYAWQGWTPAVRVMLKLGFNPAAKGHHGETALHCAAWMGRLPMVKMLLAAGAPVNVVEAQFQAPPMGWVTHGARFSRDDRQQPPNPFSSYAGIIKALLAAGEKPPKQVDAELPEVVKRALRKA